MKKDDAQSCSANEGKTLGRREKSFTDRKIIRCPDLRCKWEGTTQHSRVRSKIDAQNLKEDS